MHPLLAYLLLILAATTGVLIGFQSWVAAIPLTLFAWLLGEWLAHKLAKALRTERK